MCPACQARAHVGYSSRSTSSYKIECWLNMWSKRCHAAANRYSTSTCHGIGLPETQQESPPSTQQVVEHTTHCSFTQQQLLRMTLLHLKFHCKSSYAQALQRKGGRLPLQPYSPDSNLIGVSTLSTRRSSFFKPPGTHTMRAERAFSGMTSFLLSKRRHASRAYPLSAAVHTYTSNRRLQFTCHP